MRAIRFAVLLIIAAMAPGALIHATCAPGSCCVEAACCSAVRICQTGEGCTCTFSCGQGHSSCSCTCLPDRPIGASNTVSEVERNDADPIQAISLDAPSGVTTSTNVSLETMTALLQNMSRWTVAAAPTVKARVAHGEWKGGFRDMIETIAASYGVVADIDEKALTVRLH